MITDWKMLENYLREIKLDDVVVSTWLDGVLLGIDFKTHVIKFEEPEEW